MENFVFRLPTKIIFGTDDYSNLVEELKNYKNVLFHFGGGSIKNNWVYDLVTKALNEANTEYKELSWVKANPRLSLVHEGVELAKKENFDLILAVWWWSVIDSAKAIAAGACYDWDVWDFFEWKTSIQKAIDVGVVLTIPAAGSESSWASVITKEEWNWKKAFKSEFVLPKFSILNPEYTYTIPPFHVACGIVDMLAHMMERYFTPTKNVDVTDRLLEANMRSVIHYGKLALDNPSDYDIRAEIMWAGTIAHNNMLNSGRDGDWASHAIEHELSGIYDIAHWEGLAIVFPAWMKYVYKENIDRFVQFSNRVFWVDYSMDQKELAVHEGIRRLEEFYRSLNLKTKLSEIDIKDDQFMNMAEKCTKNGNIWLFKKLDKEDVYKIYMLAQ